MIWNRTSAPTLGGSPIFCQKSFQYEGDRSPWCLWTLLNISDIIPVFQVIIEIFNDDSRQNHLLTGGPPYAIAFHITCIENNPTLCASPAVIKIRVPRRRSYVKDIHRSG